MNCPKCHKDVEMLKFTADGTMCSKCYQPAPKMIDAAFSSMPAKVTQMDILKSMGPTRPDYFYGPGKGSVTCEPHQPTEAQMKFQGKTLPIRQLKVYWLKPADKFDRSIGHFELLHADSFACS